jgi:hypothetical protein
MHRSTRGISGARVRAVLAHTLIGATLGGTAWPEPVAGSQKVSPASELYVLNCQGCHGARGEVGSEDIRPLAFAFSTFTQTSRGRAYIMRIPGIANAPIADGPLTNLLNYLTELWLPNLNADESRPFKEAEVSALRHKPLLDVTAERAAVIRQLATAHLLSGRIAE